MNEEYFSYVEKLKQLNFKNNLEFLQKKYKNKKILLYAAGLFFDAIADNYNLTEYLNIVGICDIKFKGNKPDLYKNIKTFEPDEIKELDIDVVLACNLSPKTIENTIRKNHYISENINVEHIIQENHQTKLANEIEKIKSTISLLCNGENPFNTIKFWKYCNKQELSTKANYRKVLNRIRKTKLPLKVMFIVEENAKWGWQSIYDEMKKDNKNFEILPIVALPAGFVQYEYTQEETIEFFKKRNISAINGYDKETGKAINLKELKADLVMYQQPTCIKDYYSPEYLSENSLCCIIPYGYSSLEENSWGSDFIKTKLANMWKMFVESNYHRSYTEKAAKLRNKDIVKVSGYPKFDAYKQPISKEMLELWKETNRKSSGRIIYAPHHTIETHRHEMSNFKEQYLFFLEFAKNNPQYSFIYKPHPLLRSKCIYENFLSAEEYDEYEKTWNELPNASSYNQGDYFDIFKSSDLLITDCSSFLGEYFVSGKPIIFLDKKNRAGFNEFGELMKTTFYTPKTTEEIPQIIENLLLNKEDTSKEERLQIIAKEYFLPQEGIGVHIVNYLKDMTNRN